MNIAAISADFANIKNSWASFKLNSSIDIAENCADFAVIKKNSWASFKLHSFKCGPAQLTTDRCSFFFVVTSEQITTNKC